MGFLADLQREAERERRAREQEERRLLREYERAQREAERQAAREEKERKRLYVEQRTNEAAKLNEQLHRRIEELEGLLVATLPVDDYIDFKTLKVSFTEPSFDDRGLDEETAPPDPPQIKPPGTLGALVPGAKAKYEAALESAEAEHTQEVEVWKEREAARAKALARAREEHEHEVQEKQRAAEAANAAIEVFEEKLEDGDPTAIVDYLGMVLERSRYPDDFPRSHKLAFVPESKQVVIEHDLPDFDAIPEAKEHRYVKARDEITSSARPITQRKALYASVIAQITLRTVHEVLEADRLGHVETIVFNGMVDSIDKRTGQPARICLVTLRTTRDSFEALQLDLVDPQECLKGLGAGVSTKPAELAPVRPVLEFKMVDDRFIDESDVLSELDQRPNLLALTPSEFESLITNLFEKMGLDTRQTRPSRDGGVDCVAWDSRPVMGGKVVIQAKRYAGTVGVSAVRDLFGTVHNEGASKGILVTTSGFGKASFDFAEGKPLELLDGTNLLYLLREHADVEARIDAPEDWVDPELEEASEATKTA
ncbi:MAG: restriction system protein [Solirubrobacterales bacterium]|jgi:restriction system protein|nr:restriction system protein [Solirubrobacterales bacterium]